jgi:uncharacterized RDD family membrane protein YckC
VQAGFWHRAIALAIDILLINLVVAVIGLALTAVTGGTIRVANTVFNVIDCTSSEPVPAALAAAAGFAAADSHSCTRSLLGFVHDRVSVMTERPTGGEDGDDLRRIITPVDDTGRIVEAFYLDDLILALLAAYLLAFEWRAGATIGKRILAIRVQSLGGSVLDILQVGKRTLVRIVVLFAAELGQSGNLPSADVHRIGVRLISTHSTADLGLWSTVLMALALAYFISFSIATSRDSLPLHDRWAGTEVVRPDAAIR